MRLADAPPAGWYPDPDGGSRLRWWEGTDWTDNYRPRPTPSEIAAREFAHPQEGAAASARAAGLPVTATPEYRRDVRRESEEIIAEVRKVARSEVDRAADLFSQRARAATRDLQPLITEYTTKFFRWLRIGLVIAIVLVVGWIVFQAIVQQSFLDWIGDRIDSLTEDDSRGRIIPGTLLPLWW